MLELENHLENERLRLGELRKKHYELAGVPLEQISEGNGETSSLAHPASMSPKSRKPGFMKKPALAQKPNIAAKTIVREGKVVSILRDVKIIPCLCFFSSLSDPSNRGHVFADGQLLPHSFITFTLFLCQINPEARFSLPISCKQKVWFFLTFGKKNKNRNCLMWCNF